MLIDIFSGRGPLHEKLILAVIILLAVLISIVIHEMCHGFAAYALGDPTAKRSGRLSLNPIRHIDPIGALLMLLVGFGWAKPVMVDARYFEKPKRDMALTALAGPMSNFILAFLAVGCIKLIPVAAVWSNIFVNYLFQFFIYLATLSVGLGLFNLLPIPPLDGSKVLGAFLPDRLYWQFVRLERYGMLLLVALIMLGRFGAFDVFYFIGSLRDEVLRLMGGVFGMEYIFGVFITV